MNNAIKITTGEKKKFTMFKMVFKTHKTNIITRNGIAKRIIAVP
ncbi:hypothetical protein [Breznakia blatticola]|nr:hypothetical protein [Breznakia blatticola]